jgi:hypothetical protein
MRRFSFSEVNNGFEDNKGKDDPGLGIPDKNVFVSNSLDETLFTRLLSSLSMRL